MLPESGESFVYPFLRSWRLCFPCRGLSRRRVFTGTLTFLLRFICLWGMGGTVSPVSIGSLQFLHLFIPRRLAAASFGHERSIRFSARPRMSVRVFLDSHFLDMTVNLASSFCCRLREPSANRTEALLKHLAVVEGWRARDVLF